MFTDSEKFRHLGLLAMSMLIILTVVINQFM